MKKVNKLKYEIVFLLLALFIFVSAYSYSNAVSKDLADNIFRLHVVANSDDIQDQNLKLVIRDKVLQYVNSISKDISNKNDLVILLGNYTEEIKEIVQDVVMEQGYAYPVNISIGNFSFPTKVYGDISLPAGYYDALKIEIGEAKGNNWWCVMFPPLCFVDISSGIVPEESKNILEDSLSSEEFDIISSSDNIQIKFKIVEFFQNAKILATKP